MNAFTMSYYDPTFLCVTLVYSMIAINAVRDLNVNGLKKLNAKKRFTQ